MAVTIIDPKTALVIVDLQQGIAGLVPGAIIEPVVKNSRQLADSFRRKQLPVVLVIVDRGAPGRTEQARPVRDLPPGWTDILPELGQQPQDLVVTKCTWGAFASTDLEQRLKTLGITQVVLTGVATSSGVESTARQAYEAGFNVTLAVDAMADLNEPAHHASIAHVFPRLGETGTTKDIISLIERSS